LMTGKPSLSFILVLVSISANLAAFVLSLGIPSGASEVNPFARPGLLISLGFSVGIIVLVCVALARLLRDEVTRCVVLAAVVGVMTGDALNDFVYTVTRSQFVAVDISYGFTALIPAFVAMKLIRTRTGWSPSLNCAHSTVSQNSNAIRES
jgi:hypothetical protein